MLTGRSGLAVIEAKVAAGLLPRDRPGMMWVGAGSGKACDGCEHSITQDQREYEFDAPAWPTTRLHQDCLELWQAARLKRESGLSHETTSSCPPNSAARIAALLRDAFPAGYCVDCLAATKLSRLQSAA